MTPRSLLTLIGLVLLCIALAGLTAMIAVPRIIGWVRGRRAARSATPLPSTIAEHNKRREEVERQREHALRIHFDQQEIHRRTERAQRYGT